MGLKIRLRNRNEIYYFDLDGTLSRTDKFMIPSIELAMEKMNISVWTEDAIRCTIGEPVEVTNLKFLDRKKAKKRIISGN